MIIYDGYVGRLWWILKMVEYADVITNVGVLSIVDETLMRSASIS